MDKNNQLKESKEFVSDNAENRKEQDLDLALATNAENVVFVICPVCGKANLATAGICKKCSNYLI